ncbi:MAG: 2-amino-4-hydroxy-6-hydroxymethyldihydropteridine diphosphokinase [Chlamydiota bacterium]|nr:2-amino-4-hydroxy-6-hydroxymethyldihydropteridine diphosphokinase [Chlamydiota bacterium]
MNQVIIGVGSNINPKENILKAREAIRDEHCIRKVSLFKETLPIGRADQANFINGVFLIETSWDQVRLKQWLVRLEKRLERVRGSDPFGPRTIDLDIVVWNGAVIDGDVYERDFLQASVREVMPQCFE